MWTFSPILKSTIWGGDNILPLKGLDSTLSKIGECWEVSGMPGAESVVEEGPDSGLSMTDLLKKYGDSLVGKRNYKRFDGKFPMLVKIIDTSDRLSVQVHPDDRTATELGLPNGKNEMWYVLDSQEGAEIANGFKHPVRKEDLDSLIKSGDISNALEKIEIKQGDVFYIPAGRVHAIGAGCTLVEVQQSSDTTFRIYDYNRTDKSGNARELHKDLALRSINCEDLDNRRIEYSTSPNVPVNVIRSPFFSINILESNTEFIRDYSENDSFVVIVMVHGGACLQCGGQSATLTKGHSVLIPASATGVTIAPHGEARMLEAYIS